MEGSPATREHWKFVEPDWAFDKLVMGTCAAIRQREDILKPACHIFDCDAREREEERLHQEKEADHAR